MRDQAAINAKISASMKGKIPASKGKELSSAKRIERKYKCAACAVILTVRVSDAAWKKRHKTCSRRCELEMASIYGRQSAALQAETRRSKNEIYFFELCNARFVAIANEPMFEGWDADVILPNENLAILWNGKWHYTKLAKAHSVEQVQNRDRLKLKAIERCGYTPYVIKDLGSENRSFVEEQFSELVNWLSRGPHKAE